MVRVAVTGATGLVGECLLRLLLEHPDAQVTLVGSHSSAGKDIGDVLPSLKGEISLECLEPSAEDIARTISREVGKPLAEAAPMPARCAEIIRLSVMMYVRFPLSLRNVEDLLHERGWTPAARGVG